MREMGGGEIKVFAYNCIWYSTQYSTIIFHIAYFYFQNYAKYLNQNKLFLEYFKGNSVFMDMKLTMKYRRMSVLPLYNSADSS